MYILRIHIHVSINSITQNISRSFSSLLDDNLLENPGAELGLAGAASMARETNRSRIRHDGRERNDHDRRTGRSNRFSTDDTAQRAAQ